MAKIIRNKENEFSLKCPDCADGIISINTIEYDLPDGDKMLIVKFVCDSCNFHKHDIIPMTTRIDPGIMTLKISNENDLKSKIYRSPTGKLEIPELELIVEPGPRADFYYTNVEGILLRFEEAVLIYKNNLENNDPEWKEIEEILTDLKKALNGELKFTLQITDFGGGSYIIPQDQSAYSFKKLDNMEMDQD
ncbi:MAG: ZPR1 zinc finger domain-containing protein [Promethearchaeota archaeon]|nr:MAG: ZPR1 zinc finger domain-containing protein [Candidatus Lokiarchaeota archaeon]